MADLGFIPKHTLIANCIRDEIISGRIREGERLRPDTALAEEYGVNKRTVANGMAQLVAEGLITRAPKRGSVVIRRKVVERTSNAVGIVGYNEGDVFGDMAGEITCELLRRSFYPLWITQSIFSHALSEPNFKPFIQMLEHFLNDCPRGMIISGERFVPIDLLQRNRGKVGSLVFMYNYLHPNRIPAKYVLIDHAVAARKIVRNLAENGHRKFTFLACRQSFPASYGETPQTLLMKNLIVAAKEFDMDFDSVIPQRMIAQEEPEKVLSECFRDKEITAAVMPYDAVWPNFYGRIFDKLGIRTPDDLSLIGYNNTPWAEKLDLTSVNIFERKIAKLSVEMLLDEVSDSEIMVEPEIVIRNSVRNIR